MMEEERGYERNNNKLVFGVNGERFEVSLSGGTVDPSTTLLQFLRYQTRFKSVKLGCGEGGCGACVVLLSKYDPVLDRVEDFTVSSCLTLLCSVNGCSITTTEGLGSSKAGFHPIHQGLLASMLLNAAFVHLAFSEAEKAIAGNLCRCTGYRPIADACKSFAADVDMEDLGFNSFGKRETKQVMEVEHYDRYIDIRHIPELSMIRRDQTGIVIGATVTISKAIEALNEENGGDFHSQGEMVFKKIADHLEKIATGFIRNSASIGRNLTSETKTVLLFETYRAAPRPLGNALPHLNAAFLAEVSPCEAVFVDDIPSPANCLYGAFIYSTKPLARIKGIEFNSKSLPSGVTALLSYKDIPECGENIGSKFMFGPEPLFADELTRCAELPILSVEEAIERSSLFEVPPSYIPIRLVIYRKEWMKPITRLSLLRSNLGHNIISTWRQTALAVPDEDNCLVVYSSIQCPEYAHATIARCMGIPEHNVRVITRRVGGGFGGKATKAMLVATACALAAYKLHRPVRIYVNRKTDMIMAGGRHPMKITYSVGYKSNGKITALQLEILIDAGLSPDVSPMMPGTILGALKKYDWGALSFDIKVCKTNLPSRSAMRAPGEVQGSFIAEAVIEHVASTLSMEVDIVRNINLHTYNTLNMFYENSAGESMEYTLPSIWDKLAIQTPGKVSILSDGSVVVEVGGIELGQGLWTKVKQMVAFALSSIQCVGSGDLLEKIRVVQSDTLSLIQGSITAGSTTSESSCEAVRLCCNTLVERLTLLKERLLEQMGSINWETLILQAHQQAVNLSASSFYVPDFTSRKYLNYGAAVSEVEVNILTGETTILRSDIVYDCGQSLNPAVDVGQIEGSFVQGIGFFMLEEYPTNSDGLVISKGTWTYKIPTMDTIPKQFNVEILNSRNHQKRVLSSKASGEPPLLLSVSVHCATRAAIKEPGNSLFHGVASISLILHFIWKFQPPCQW
ncbi:hypothetical protein LWI28_028030 [Acer negundo]|uniref:indole-3-acetaldehyde oxidase n=1 Tax=Acer negundo TaxID=4023 RepID=A0AAD5JMG2_ACENE|nr:hypothetical protein LWI28_028030 [Acer negundo]